MSDFRKIIGNFTRFLRALVIDNKTLFFSPTGAAYLNLLTYTPSLGFFSWLREVFLCQRSLMPSKRKQFGNLSDTFLRLKKPKVFRRDFASELRLTFQIRQLSTPLRNQPVQVCLPPCRCLLE